MSEKKKEVKTLKQSAEESRAKKEAEEAQKKLKRVGSLLEVMKTPNSFYSVRLGFKNWNMQVVNFNGSLKIIVRVRIKNKTFVKLNASPSDLMYLRTLVSELYNEMKSLGADVGIGRSV